MSRFTDILLIGLYALIAAASSAALIRLGGFDGPFAWLAGIQIFLVMGLVQAMTGRRADARRMDELVAFTSNISRDLEIAEARLEELDLAVEGHTPSERAFFADELARLEEEVTRLREAAGSAEAAPGLAAASAFQPAPAELAAEEKAFEEAFLSEPAPRFDEPRPRPALQLVTQETSGPLLSDEELLPLVRDALEHDRLDLYLQPIVTLPQRQTSFYEALTRLRGPQGEVILPADYIRVAEPAGLMPILDNMALLRCVQVTRQMEKRKKDTPIFCNISAHTLCDTEFFPQFLDYMKDHEELASRLVFEIGQDAYDAAGAVEHESLRDLAALGFRLSLDRVRRLDMDPHQLHATGFRFVKIDAVQLLDAAEGGTPFFGNIHPQDVKELMRRAGLTLIAERIESERTVVDILDYDLDYGQGFLFARPRPVRKNLIAA
ncbi:EAL domain-containing protein [Tepidicaulis sp. LMO-SS28]|uniref:EAL domain-containing protein n=1 Tax=Tepidicaulis sp. LMO-SS28 TaxID=3447455 RepID=UPI003EE18E2A